MAGSPLAYPVRAMGRHLPGLLRFLTFHNPLHRGRWTTLVTLVDDPQCSKWLASIENPTRTRHGFEIYTVPNDTTSDWIKVHGQHEVSTERFILSQLKPGSTFLDIGSNIGYFAILAAHKVGASVIAFEPQRAIAELLEKTVAHNRLGERVQVANLALSDRAATMRMTSVPGNTGHAQLAEAPDVATDDNLVSVVVLDDWLGPAEKPPVTVCKIDTEGAEFQVLCGMAKLLDRDGPALVIELIDKHLAQFGSSSAQVREFLSQHGYRDVTGTYGNHGDENGYFIKPL